MGVDGQRGALAVLHRLDGEVAAAGAAVAAGPQAGPPGRHGQIDFGIALRVRSTPFIEMLERCRAADVEVVWGI